MENYCTESKNSTINRIQVLHGIVPLQRIFFFLDLKHVKIIRLVCQHWAEVGATFLSGCSFFLDNYHLNTRQIGEFVAQHGIQHRVYLSTLPKPWDLVFEDRPSLKRSDALKLNLKQLNYSDNLTTNHTQDLGQGLTTYLQICGRFVTDIRLETSLDNEEDLNYLIQIFKRLSNLKKVCFDFSKFNGDIVLLLPTNLIPQTAKTATFRVYDAAAYFMRPEHSSKFVEMVEPFVEFLDFVGWGKEGKRQHYQSENFLSWLEAVDGVIKGKKCAFSNLKGVRGTADVGPCGNDFSDFLQGWPSQLEFIDVNLPYVCSPIIRQMNEIILRNRLKLRSVAIKIFGRLNDDDVGQTPFWPYDPLDIQVDLSPLKNLQHLTLSLVDGVAPPWCPQTWPQRLWDIYKLRQLLMDNLKQLPLLTSLCVIFTGPDPTDSKNEYWDFIFPAINSNEKPLILPGLKELVVSCCGACDSKINNRLRSIFPNLLIFRHIKETRDSFVWGCEEFTGLGCDVSSKEFLVCTQDEIQFVKRIFIDKLLIDRLSIRRNVDFWNQLW